MTGYILNFTVYTLAMVGVIFLALMVFKKTALNQNTKVNNRKLSVEESMNLTPRKSLYIVKAGGQRFLIASDLESTTMLSELEAANATSNIRVIEKAGSKDEIEDIKGFEVSEAEKTIRKEVLSSNISDIFQKRREQQQESQEKQPVMKSLIAKLKIQRG